MLKFDETKLITSGDRFTVEYSISGSATKAYTIAKDICLEQTVEFPGELVPDEITKKIVGKIKSFDLRDDGRHTTVISYPIETAGTEFLQLLNVVFGNISIIPGIRVEDINLPESLLQYIKGPRFGRDGLRKLLNVEKRPLLFTALKPMGLSAKELAELAYQFALGGLDIIKDDHGLANQAFSSFEERVRLCTEAVRKANKETGNNCIYAPNITASFNEIRDRAMLAKNLGAGGLLIAPGLAGHDTMKCIAEDDSIALPIFAHPAFSGTYVHGNNGISHKVLYGQMARLAGADITIFPNFGGRFSFTIDECKSIVMGTESIMGNLKKTFPGPAGGMSIDGIPASYEVYKDNVAFLVGGGLFRHGSNLVDNCKYFKELVEKISS